MPATTPGRKQQSLTPARASSPVPREGLSPLPIPLSCASVPAAEHQAFPSLRGCHLRPPALQLRKRGFLRSAEWSERMDGASRAGSGGPAAQLQVLHQATPPVHADDLCTVHQPTSTVPPGRPPPWTIWRDLVNHPDTLPGLA